MDHRPFTTQWLRHEVECSCGHRTRAAYDPKQIPASPFGTGLMATVVLLTGDYHMSRRRAQRLLYDLYGIKIFL